MDDTEPEARAEADTSTALVEVLPGTVVLFGDVPEGVEVVPFSLLTLADREALGSAFARSTGLLNAGAQIAPALAHAQGVVRLAPETLAALQAGATPLQSGGYNLGTLAAQGKFAASVRWLPLTGATAVGVAAALGPALAMMAIQTQLHSLTKLTRENLELTETLLNTVRAKKWAELKGLDLAVSRAVQRTNEIGGVATSVWDSVSGLEKDLDDKRSDFHKAVSDHANALSAARLAQARRQYLERNSEAILMDVHSLMVAHKAWFQYQALFTLVARQRGQAEELEARLAERQLAFLSKEYDDAVTQMSTLLDAVLREAWILSELPGKRTLPFTNARQSAVDVATMARRLSESVAQLAGAVGHSEPAPIAAPSTLCLASEEGLETTLKILRWHLHREETLECLAHARQQQELGDVLIAVTSERVLLANRTEFYKQGVVSQAIANSDIRYVRFQPEVVFGGPKPLERIASIGVVIDVTLRTSNITWIFPRGFATDHPVKALAALLMNRMNLPERERTAFNKYLPRPALT